MLNTVKISLFLLTLRGCSTQNFNYNSNPTGKVNYQPPIEYFTPNHNYNVNLNAKYENKPIAGRFQNHNYNTIINSEANSKPVSEKQYDSLSNTNGNSALSARSRNPVQQEDGKPNFNIQQKDQSSGDPRQLPQRDQNRNYIQKMANQLFLTQKHVPLLSEYQKYILNQDPLVKKYVFGNQEQPQQTTQKVKSHYVQRSLHTTPLKPVPEARSFGNVKTIVNPQQALENGNKFKKAGDQNSQPTELQYLTLQPSLIGYGALHKAIPEVTLLTNPQPLHYDLGGIPSYQIKTAPTVSSVSHFGLESHKSYPIHLKHVDEDYEHGQNYQFAYDIKDLKQKNDFGHSETRSNDKTTGQYYLQLPDGRFETVNYWADKSGYHAKVEFVGRSIHPEH